MGRRSKRRQGKGQQDGNSFTVLEELEAIDIGDEEKPRNAKHSAKIRKRLKKQLKKEKQKEKYGKRNAAKEKESNTPNRHPGWHLVTVSGGAPVEKNFLFTSIGNYVEVEFQPLGFHKVDNMSCFYLEGNGEAADAIRGLTKRIQGPDGSVLKIGVTNSPSPDFLLNTDQLQVLKEVMARRFDSTSCLLNLTNLHHDDLLMEKDMLVTLSSPGIMKQVLRLIKENIPHLKALSLSKNGLRSSSMKMFQDLHTSSSELNALNLGHNYITDMLVLRYVKMFPLTELNLEANPVVINLKNKPMRYINLVKKELKSLKLLDSVDVDAYLAENIKEKEQVIQPPKLQHVGTASSSSAITEPMVRTFLEQYYNLIDTQERSNLVAAYTPDAVLEIKSAIAAVGSSVFLGQSKISEALTSLPATKHEHSTISLDVKLVNPSNAVARVKGQCQMAGVESVIAFSRTMNIIPYNAGLCCSQELLEMRRDHPGNS